MKSPQWEKWLGRLIIFGLAAMLVVIFSQKIEFNSSDLGRHLANGRELFRDRAVLFTNFYSYTLPEARFVNHHWLAGLIYYGLYQIGGFNLLSVFNIFLILLAAGLLFILVKRRLGLSAAAWLFLPALVVLSERVEVRPEIFSYLFLALTVFILDYARRHPRFKAELYLLPLFFLWANIHIYFFLGLALIGFRAAALFLNGILAAAGNGRSRILGAWKASSVWLWRLAAVLLVCLANPNTWRGLLYPLNILRDYGYDIVENKSIFFLSHLVVDYNFAIFKGMLIFLLLCLLARFVLERRFDLENIFSTLFFTLLALFASRNLALFALIFPWLVVDNFRPVLDFWRSRLADFSARFDYFRLLTRGVLLAVIIFFAFYFIFDGRVGHNFIRHQPGLGLSDSGEGAANFIKSRGLVGPIFNNYDSGSALAFTLFPAERVFVDNRPEAYGVKFFSEIYRPLQEDESKWAEYVRQKQPNIIYFSHTDITPWADSFLRRRLADSSWSLVYFDQEVVVLLRVDGANREAAKEMRLSFWDFRRRFRELSVSSAGFSSKLDLASLAIRAKQPDLAEEAYRDLISQNENQAIVWASLGMLYSGAEREDDLRSALGYFEQAFKLGYRLPSLYNNAGLVYWQLGEYDKAEESWKKALKQERRNASALYYLNQINELRLNGSLPFKSD